jgi:butyryl-CoA dehydrogenase
MMNEARIGTGLMAAGTASAAYYASLQYAKERPQGRHPDNKVAGSPPVLIIEHADVRRMLLFQKAVVEGSVALLLQCSLYNDISENHPDEKVRHRNHALLELLTPIAKSYPSEYGNESTSIGMQVLGGAGYTDDFPLEQHFRDIRVNSIYEGTTTIHGMDLLGRKMLMNDGESVSFLTEEIMATLQEAMPMEELAAMGSTLGKSLEGVQQVMQKLTGIAQTQGPRAYLADATLFLDYFALHVLGWLWIKQGVSAVKGLKTAEGESEKLFYRSKLQTARYFFNYELPKVSGLKRILLGTEQVTLKTTAEELI